MRSPDKALQAGGWRYSWKVTAHVKISAAQRANAVDDHAHRPVVFVGQLDCVTEVSLHRLWSVCGDVAAAIFLKVIVDRNWRFSIDRQRAFSRMHSWSPLVEKVQRAMVVLVACFAEVRRRYE